MLMPDQTPPQLWKVDAVGDQPELTMERVFIAPGFKTEFAGISVFGGPNDSLVLGAGRGAFSNVSISDPLTWRRWRHSYMGQIHWRTSPLYQAYY